MAGQAHQHLTSHQKKTAAHVKMSLQQGEERTVSRCIQF